MLVAIKTKKISKLSVLNSKKESIILNIPHSEWVIIEDINSPDLLLNKEAIISEGGEVYVSLWRSDPPFGEKVYYMRSGFNTTIVSTFDEIKRVSKDAILELSKEANDSYDTILQDKQVNSYIEGIDALAESTTEKIAGYKSAFENGRISEEIYQVKIYEIFAEYMGDVQERSRLYFIDVFDFKSFDSKTIDAYISKIVSQNKRIQK